MEEVLEVVEVAVIVAEAEAVLLNDASVACPVLLVSGSITQMGIPVCWSVQE